MIRYWHWLVSQKKTEPELFYYNVNGAATEWFDPDLYGVNDDNGNVNINTEQNDNNSGN
jgi:hypothetical protein